MKVMRVGSKPSSAGPAETFTGRVRRDPLMHAEAPGRVMTGQVTFEAGARTAWHVHPLGQLLIVTAGCGWAQGWGEEKNVIRPGDVVWIPAGQKHWHGAAADTAMTHIAITESLDGSAVDWLEHVTDEQFLSDGTGA